MNMKRLKQLPAFVRFIMVGIFATALHYGIYIILQQIINVNIAYSIGYVLSFIANFYLTAFFTFRKSLPGKGFWVWRSTSGQLSSTYEFIESIPLAWNIEAICTYTGIRHRYSGKLLAG